MTGPAADGKLERALDGALGRALRAPNVPETFHCRLNAGLARAADSADLSTLRKRLESERREQLGTLEANYIRVRRSALGTLIGVAFAAGAAAAIALPWLRAHLGAHTPQALAWGGIALGLGIAFFEPLRRLLRRY